MASIPMRVTDTLAESSFRSELPHLFSLADDGFGLVFKLVDDGAPSYSDIRALSDRGEVGPEDALSAMNVAAFLTRAVIDYGVTASDLVTALESSAEAKVRDQIVARRDDLVRLLDAVASARRAALSRRASTSFLPVLRDVEAAWDLRAVTDSNGVVLGYVPVLVMQLIAQGDAEDREIHVQLDATGFGRFRDTVQSLASSLNIVSDCAVKLTAEIDDKNRE